MKIRYGIIGRKFGQNYIDTIKDQLPEIAEAPWTCSKNSSKCALLADSFQLLNTNDYKEICKSDVDVIVVASPASQHFSMVEESLLNNKHTISEKPFTLDLNEAISLNVLARSKNLNLCIDYTDLYNQAYRTIKARLKNKPTFIEYEISGPVVHEDCGTAYDYLSHGIAVCLDLMDQYPTKIIKEEGEDKAIFKLHFNKCVALLRAQRRVPTRRRTIDVWAEDQHFLYDGAANQLWEQRNDDWDQIRFNNEPPLTTLIREFTEILQNKQVKYHAELAVDVTRVLEEML